MLTCPWVNSGETILPPYDKPEDILEAVSGAHIYNHPIVQAESFTDLESKWYEHPFALKAQGDYNLCKGVNKIFFHVYAQQPYITKQPGITLDHIGLHFNRGQTWWKQAKGWIDYITTCQSVLQKGHQEADILCFTGSRDWGKSGGNQGNHQPFGISRRSNHQPDSHLQKPRGPPAFGTRREIQRRRNPSLLPAGGRRDLRPDSSGSISIEVYADLSTTAERCLNRGRRCFPGSPMPISNSPPPEKA